MSCAEATFFTSGSCKNRHITCGWCKREFCGYHGPCNDGGTVGGHSNCSGPKCSVTVGGASCGGGMKKCDFCELWYCQNHVQYGGGVGQHCCDIGCDTTLHTKKNCDGTCQDVKPCVAGCGYKFCGYHFVPVASILTPVGGHVCKKVTAGSEVIGDSAADYFMLLGDAAMAAGSGGTSVAASVAAKAAAKAVAKKILENALDMAIKKLPNGDKLVQLKGIAKQVKALKDVDPEKIKAHMHSASKLVR